MIISKKHIGVVVILGLCVATHSVKASNMVYNQPDGFSAQLLEGEGTHFVAQFDVPQNTLLKAGSLFIFSGGTAHCVSPATHYDITMKLSDDPTFTGGSEVNTDSLQYDCAGGFQTNATTSVDYQMYVGTHYYIGLDVAFADQLIVLSASTTNASGWIFNNSSSTDGMYYDLYRLNGVASSTGALSDQQTLDVGKYCNVLSGWDATQCFLSLFVVSGDQGTSLATTLQNGLLTKVPFGYATRMYNILATTTASTSLPQISYTFGPSSPLTGVTWSLNMQNVFDQASAIENTTLVSDSTTSPLNAWGVLGTTVTTLLWLIFALQVLHDLSGFHVHGQKPNSPQAQKT